MGVDLFQRQSFAKNFGIVSHLEYDDKTKLGATRGFFSSRRSILCPND